MDRIKIYIMLGMFILGRGNIYGLGDNDLKQKNILTSKVLPTFAALGVSVLIGVGGYYVYDKKTNDNLDNLNYEKCSYKSKNFVNKIEIDEKFSDIDVSVGNVSNVDIDYYQNKNRKYEILEEKGTLKIKKLAKITFNIFDGNTNEETRPLKIVVPKNKIDLDISSGFGDIFLNDLESSRVNVDHSYGNVNFKNLNAENIEINYNHGNINFEHLNVKDITIKISFGNASGSLVGSEKNYTINANTNFGNCNLKNSSSGSRKLNVSIKFGEINISFDNKNLPR